MVDLLAAAQEGPRHIIPEDQQLRHFERGNDVAIDAPIHLECGKGAQQHAPFIRVRHDASIGARYQVALVRGENAGGAVGALQEGTDASEMKGLIAHHGADGDPAREVRALLHPLHELTDVGAR